MTVGLNTAVNTANIQTATKPENKPAEKAEHKKMSTTTKVAIGVGATAVAVGTIALLMLRGKHSGKETKALATVGEQAIATVDKGAQKATNNAANNVANRAAAAGTAATDAVSKLQNDIAKQQAAYDKVNNQYQKLVQSYEDTLARNGGKADSCLENEIANCKGLVDKAKLKLANLEQQLAQLSKK